MYITQVYELFDLDPASWAQCAALVAQLVRASVRSAECHGFKSHLRQFIFIFSLPQVSVFLCFYFPSQVIMYLYFRLKKIGNIVFILFVKKLDLLHLLTVEVFLEDLT